MGMDSTRALAVILAGAMVCQPGIGSAQPLPGSVRDLVGARASSGESALETRGFTYISGGTRNGRKLGYWWNPNTRECVRVATADGAFEQITVAPKTDCNQRSGSNHGAVAAAVGAAALIGVLALAHKSHDHDNDRHYGDVQDEAQYERGYRDGLYSHSYHNYDRSQSYTSGYENGVRARGDEAGYRGGHYYGGGYGAHVSLRDLEGRERPYAIDQLASRGFVQRDSKRIEDGRYATFWREASRQCVIVTSHNGYVTSIERSAEQTCSY